MGGIKIIVDQQGNIGIQSDFDHGTTLLILHKSMAETVNQPIQIKAGPQLEVAPPGLVGRLNGRTP